MTLLILFIIWLCFWSFSTVLIERWHSWKSGIVNGRSECPKCNHILSAKELIPVLSYLLQWWKCRNCGKKIPLFYPMAEVFMWIIFVICWYVWLMFWYDVTSLNFWLFIILGFITGLYMMYDIRFMEIPDQVMIPSIVWIIILLVAWFFSDIFHIFFDLGLYDSYKDFFLNHLLWAWFLYTFFFLQILIPWGFYLLKKKKFAEFFTLCSQYITFPLDVIIWFLDKDRYQEVEKEEEIPSWVWWWDLRVGLFIGLTLWIYHSIFALMFAYIFWSIYGIGTFIAKGENRTKEDSIVPFWPFLWVGWILVLVLYDKIPNIFL